MKAYVSESTDSDEVAEDAGEYVRPVVDSEGRNENGETEVVIAVMGITGAGKSYLIRQATGQPVNVGNGLEACTQRVEGITMRYKNKNVTFLDSPGFNDTYRSDTEVLGDISSYLASTYNQGLKLSGIIYLHPITNVRMDGPSLRSLRMFRKLVGADALHNVILATTHWDDVSPALGARREGDLRAKFWKDLIDQGARMTRYAGDQQSSLELLDTLVERDRILLDIQREMVDEKRDLIDTGAGQVLNEDLIELRKKYEKELQDAKEELHQAFRDKDEQSKKELAQAIKGIEEKLEAAEREREIFGQRSFQKEREHQDLIQLMHLARKKEKDALEKKQGELEKEIQDLRQNQPVRPGINAGDVLPHVANICESAARAFFMYLNMR